MSQNSKHGLVASDEDVVGAVAPSAPAGKTNYVPLFLVFLSGIGFSIQTLFIKLLSVDDGFSGSFQIIFFRGLTQLALASLFIRCSKVEDRDVPLFGGTNRIRLLLFLRSTFGYLGIAFAFLSVERLPIGDSTVLIMLSPLFASMASFVMLGEPWRGGEFVATLVSLTGVVLVSRPPFFFADTAAGESPPDPTGVLFALIAAVSAGFAYTIVRMLGTTAKMPWANVCFAQAIGQIVLSPPSLWVSGQGLNLALPPAQCAIIFTAGFVGAWSQISMTVGMQREKSALATGMRMSDVLFGFIWQALFTSEAVTGMSVGGAFLVIISVLILVGSKSYYDNLDKGAGMDLGADSLHPRSAADAQGGASGAGDGTYSALHSDSQHASPDVRGSFTIEEEEDEEGEEEDEEEGGGGLELVTLRREGAEEKVA